MIGCLVMKLHWKKDKVKLAPKLTPCHTKLNWWRVARVLK